MRSNPIIGPKAPLGQGGPGASRTGPSGQRSGGFSSGGGAPRSQPAANQSLNNDWFTAALNKKK
jgi:hypothetical protein